MDYTNKGFGTKAVHAGNVHDKQYGALTMPIYQTSTFVFESCEQGAARFSGKEAGIRIREERKAAGLSQKDESELCVGELCIGSEHIL